MRPKYNLEIFIPSNQIYKMLSFNNNNIYLISTITARAIITVPEYDIFHHLQYAYDICKKNIYNK